MAVKNGFGIDIGQDSIKLVELRKEKGGIHLSRAKILKTEITPSLPRAERENIIAEKLSEILGDVKVRKSPLVIATPGLSAFIRYVKLPPVTPSRLQQIIGYEAQQQVPFPLEEVIWDYQVLKGGGKSETNVILVAIKSEVVDNLMDTMSLQGVEPSVVEHRPLALYNCVMFNEETEGKVTIIIDVGATATDLSIEREGELCWTRSARIGGEDITEAIQNAFHTSFEEAEKLKTEKGTIYVTENEEKSADGETKRLWDAMRPVVQELITELQRSVSYFHSQLEGGTIDRVLLTGGCSRLRNFDLLVKDQLGVEVKRLNPLKNIAYSPEILEAEDVESRFGVAIGLALRAMGQGFSTIDLLPKVVVGRRELRKKTVYLMLSGLCMALMLGVSAAFSLQNSNVMKLQLEHLTDELKQYRTHEGEIAKLKKEQREIEEKINILKNLVLARDYWPNILLEFSRLLPDNAVLKSISSLVQEDKKLIEVEGRTANYEEITNLISCLEQSALFGKVEVKSAKEVEESVSPTGRARRVERRMMQFRPDPTRETVNPRVEEKRIPTPVVRKASIDFVLHVELISAIPLEEIVIRTPERKIPGIERGGWRPEVPPGVQHRPTR